MSVGKRIATGLFVAITLVATLSASLAYNRAPTVAPSAERRQTRSVTRGDFLVTVTETGTVESYNNTEIKCKIRGGYGGKGGHSLVTWVIPAGTFVEAGDELVRLDTKVIDETISLGKTDTNSAIAMLARAEADAKIAKTAVAGYLDGAYRAQRDGLESQVETAKWNLKTAQSMLRDSKVLFRNGYVSRFEVQANEYTVRQAALELNVSETQLDVLERFTKQMQLARLQGQVEATESRLAGRRAGVELEQSRLTLAEQELLDCTIEAPRDGLVIYPSAAKWKDTPDVAEGVSVHNNQVLLLMPDLTRMQVVIGVHESIVDRLEPGQPVNVKLASQTLESTVHLVAPIAIPAGWWNGNAVRYDTTVRLPANAGLRPGMTAEVEVTLASYKDVLSVPVNAVVETPDGHFCWVETEAGAERRQVQLGDSNSNAIVVESGLQEGEVVVIDPVTWIADAQNLFAPTMVHTAARGDLFVTLTEQGTLESSNNTEIKCQVRGTSTVNWVIESGTEVKEGDELVRLENKEIEEHIRERTKFAYLSKDAAIGFRVAATVAGLAIGEYLEGRYRNELFTLEKDLVVAQQNLLTAQNMLEHTKEMNRLGYQSQLDLRDRETAARQAELTVEGKKLELEVLQKFTKEEQLITLRGDWEAAKAEANGHEEVLKNDNARIQQAKEEFERCVIRAPRDGLVIYPRGEAWKDEPEIAEGSSATNNQVLLLMPDLAKMQVKVGIHESMLDQTKPGMKAIISLPHGSIEGKVISVASVADPAGWWTGNIVKYEAVVEIPEGTSGLKPGMSAEVEIEIAYHPDVLQIPLSAVVETPEGSFCWVGDPQNAERRAIQLGDFNDTFVMVTDGLESGEQVVLDPVGLETQNN